VKAYTDVDMRSLAVVFPMLVSGWCGPIWRRRGRSCWCLKTRERVLGL